jgi:hypothetical protein
MASTIVPNTDPQLKKNVADLFGDAAAALVHDAWRVAVAEIADKAKVKLPECSGRVDSAVKLVLAGDVELLPDGTAKVASQSNGNTVYHIVNGECSCKDYPKAPHQFCKHRLGAAIARRAHELTQSRLTSLDHASNGTSQPPK